jgi:hypothetical protein
MTTTTINTDLTKAAAALAAREVLTQTNSGTYSAIEAQRAIGTGDPQHADCRVYERVGDGRRRVEGCHPDRAPGRVRHIGAAELSDAKKELAELRKQIAAGR